MIIKFESEKEKKAFLNFLNRIMEQGDFEFIDSMILHNLKMTVERS